MRRFYFHKCHGSHLNEERYEAHLLDLSGGRLSFSECDCENESGLIGKRAQPVNRVCINYTIDNNC